MQVCFIMRKIRKGDDRVAIKFKDNAADIVKTVDRAGLMTNRFKNVAMRTKDDLEDIFGQNDSSYEGPSDAAIGGVTDGTVYAVRAGDELIHRSGSKNRPAAQENDEYIHHSQLEYGRNKAIEAIKERKNNNRHIDENNTGSVEIVQHRGVEERTIFGLNRQSTESFHRNEGITGVNLQKSSKTAENIQRQRRQYVAKRIREHGNSRFTAFLPGSGSTHGNGKSLADKAGRILRKIIDDAKALFTSYAAAGTIALLIVIVMIFFGAGFTLIGDENGDNFAYDFYEIGPGDTAIVKVAQAQLGNVGGNKYWKWYGFSSHVHWCACFVSWCGDQCGYIKAGIIPRYAGCDTGANWFKQRHRWASGGYSPKPGDIIFFDYDHNGSMNHTGIVESCDGKTVTTIEGNSGNACRRQTYVRGSSQIAGYGVPAFNLAPKTKKEDKEKETE